MKKKNKRVISILLVFILILTTPYVWESIIEAKEIVENNNLTLSKTEKELIVVKTGVTTNSMNVRKGPSTSYSIVGKLAIGTKVEIVEVDKETGWYKIKYGDGYAYVSYKYVKIDGEELPVIKTGVTTNSMNVRIGPSTSYNSIGKLSAGTEIKIVEVDKETGWYKIKYYEGYAYVSYKYVRLDGEIEELPVIKTGVTTNSMNVRKGPSTDYSIVGKLASGATVEIVEIDSSTGWYKIKYDEGYAYVSYKYVRIEGDRVYQNPSKYFQIQDKISFEGQGGYILKRGSMGLKVRKVQVKLGMGTSNKAIIGPTTTSKIKAFQKKKGLPQTGEVYYKTWKALGLSDDDWYNLGSYVSPMQVDYNSTKKDCIDAMIDRAYDYLGTEYIVGASGKPGQGVDCSGLVMQCLYAAGINPLPVSVIRHSQPGYEYESRNLFNSSKFKKVSYSERKRGDLIFYSNSNGVIIHVAIYLGNDKVIESWPNKVVVWPIKNSHRSRIAGVRRVFV